MRYFYLHEGRAIGPISLVEALALRDRGVIGAGTMLSGDGKDYRMLMHFPELGGALMIERSSRSVAAYVLLAIFLGGLGIHNFYAGYTGRGIVKVVLTLTGVGWIISELWAVLEACTVRQDADGREMA